MRVAHLLVAVVSLALLAGCAVTPTASDNASPSPVPGESREYSSDGFAVPFTVTVSPEVPIEPYDPGSEQVTWESLADPNDRIRFVAPVAVFPPGSDIAIDPPADYASYLRSLGSSGAVISDESSLEVDGAEVAIMTVTSGVALDGAIGCIADVGKGDADCFGAQPDLYLRIVVIPVGDRTVLAWARTDPAAPNLAFVESFEQMVQTARFEG